MIFINRLQNEVEKTSGVDLRVSNGFVGHCVCVCVYTVPVIHIKVFHNKSFKKVINKVITTNIRHSFKKNK